MKILIILLLWIPVTAVCDVYQWKDADGNKHFTDKPVLNASKLDIKPAFGSQDVSNSNDLIAVKKVYDGDTVVLEDGRKIRLLGINTPEIQHRSNMAEAGGDEAKIWLTDKLKGLRVRVETDTEQKDAYDRVLAHLFTENNEHINLQLVEIGLASVSIFPPNLRYADELIAAGKRAESSRLGIWHRPEYSVIAVDNLPESGHYGWRRVVGEVKAIKSSKKYVYLKFNSRFEVRIERTWLGLFPDVNSYLGHKLEVRGWINRFKDLSSMLIRHPASIVVL